MSYVLTLPTGVSEVRVTRSVDAVGASIETETVSAVDGEVTLRLDTRPVFVTP